MNHPEHARTGTSAVGGSRQSATSLRRGRGRPAPPPELVIVDLIAQHNKQPHEELAGDGDFGLRASAAMHEREIGVRLRSASMRAACEAACPRAKRSSVLPCLVMWPR